MNEKFMREAISLGIESVKRGGGPFGAVIVKDDEIVATGANRVTLYNDPTAHAEVVAIRNACQRLDTFQLDGCEIYSSCEPCPMCLGAIYWAHIDRLYFGCNQKDADAIGFNDEFIYKEIALEPQFRKLKTSVMLHDEALAVFDAWREKDDKVEY